MHLVHMHRLLMDVFAANDYTTLLRGIRRRRAQLSTSIVKLRDYRCTHVHQRLRIDLFAPEI
jgi:hypothetical protein